MVDFPECALASPINHGIVHVIAEYRVHLLDRQVLNPMVDLESKPQASSSQAVKPSSARVTGSASSPPLPASVSSASPTLSLRPCLPSQGSLRIYAPSATKHAPPVARTVTHAAGCMIGGKWARTRDVSTVSFSARSSLQPADCRQERGREVRRNVLPSFPLAHPQLV